MIGFLVTMFILLVGAVLLGVWYAYVHNKDIRRYASISEEKKYIWPRTYQEKAHNLRADYLIRRGHIHNAYDEIQDVREHYKSVNDLMSVGEMDALLKSHSRSLRTLDSHYQEQRKRLVDQEFKSKKTELLND